jgi:CheY-like chemotaxis protein
MPVFLIVEDHAPLRRLLRRWLTDTLVDCCILEARSGEEAVALVRDQSPDLVLMDIGLPAMKGIEATRRIKAILPQVPVVIVTALDEAIHGRAAHEAGAGAYIMKTAMHTDLLQALTALLPALEVIPCPNTKH